MLLSEKIKKALQKKMPEGDGDRCRNALWKKV
jgi:hypothetical protein